jgi:Periplasmic copper-binding protein (NosD)
VTTYYCNYSTGNDSTGTGSSGSPWQTPGKGLASISPYDILGLQNTSPFQVGTGLSFTGSGSFTYDGVTRIVGCTTTVGDGGMATILSTGAITALTFTGGGGRIENLIFDGNTRTGTIGIAFNGDYQNSAINCQVKNQSSYGVYLQGGDNASIIGIDVSGCGAAGILSTTPNASIDGCKSHANAGAGIMVTGSCSIKNSTIYANTGSSAYHGILVGFVIPIEIVGCTIDGNGGDGIQLTNYLIHNGILNNILTRNGGYGINTAAMSPAGVDAAIDYNWFGTGSMANTSGARNIILAGAHDLSGDPQYNNAGAGDFTPTNPAVQAGSP